MGTPVVAETPAGPLQGLNTVVFDVGKVLLDWDPRYLYRRLFGGDEAAMERFLAEVCTREWNEEQDRGRSWADAVRERVARFPQHRALIEAYDTRWMEMAKGEFEGTVAIQARLKAMGLKLYALTNFSREKWVECLPRFASLRAFDGVLMSSDEGLVKPDPRFFGLLTSRFGVVPSQALFIDDLPANVESAARLGFRAVLFTTSADLARVLNLAHA